TRHAGVRLPARRPRSSPSRHLGGGGGPRPAREISTVHESARSGRQAVAALGPSAPQHRATGLRPHPQTEAVLLAPSAIVRLERPLHAWPPRTPRATRRAGPRGAAGRESAPALRPPPPPAQLCRR